MPSRKAFKIGAATLAATVGVIFAITSVFAHSTPSSSGSSIVGSIVKAATLASFPVFTTDPAATTLTDEQDQDAIEAAEAAAALAAEQQKEAAEKAAELAAQQAAAACKATDQPEDVAERTADQTEDKSETPTTSGDEETANPADQTEDAAEKAADKTEDAAEPKCHVSVVNNETDEHKSSEQKTFSFTTERRD